MAKNWIARMKFKKGQLHRDLDVPQGKPISAEKLEEAEERGGKVAQRARLAKTFRGLRHVKSGGK